MWILVLDVCLRVTMVERATADYLDGLDVLLLDYGPTSDINN